jgi:streptogrisin C
MWKETFGSGQCNSALYLGRRGPKHNVSHNAGAEVGINIYVCSCSVQHQAPHHRCRLILLRSRFYKLGIHLFCVTFRILAMELTRFLTALAVFLPIVYGAPTTAANSLHPEILAAMKRDLGLDAEQAHIRVARELKATEVIEQLRTSTSKSFGGAWLVDGELNVAVTDESLISDVTSAGATALLVSTPLYKLEEAQKALDKLDIEQALGKRSEEAAGGIAAYYVDVAANKLVIEALSGSTALAEELVKQVGLVESEFEVRTVQNIPTTFATVRGGDAYLINRGGRCSVGFSVTTGFVSAGHCGTVGASASTSGGVALGTFSGSVFPGNGDYSYIRGSSGNSFAGSINNYSGGTLPVSGSTATATGASICRSGSTTGVFCGTVRSLGATVSYSQGRVTGLTQTNVCAEPGDSGGSFYSGAQAQGVTSGGSGDCTSGGTTYFQPVNEILSAYSLTLVRG